MVRVIREESANARVGVLVDVDCRAEPELVTQHASAWFSAVPESLAPGLTARLRASAPPAGVTPTDWERPFGEPGQMIGIVTTMRWSRGRVTGSSRWYTRSTEASLSNALRSGSFRTSVVVDVLDELGRPSHTDETVDGTSRSFAAFAEVNDQAPGWLRLTASASAASLCADEHAQTAWTEALTTVMDRLPVTFGYLGLVGTHDRTLWEAATMRTQMYTWENTEHSHDWLRGFG